MSGNETAACLSDSLFLPTSDGIPGRGRRRSRLHLDHRHHIPASGDDVDLTPMGSKTARQHSVPFQPQRHDRQVLSPNTGSMGTASLILGRHHQDQLR